MRNRHLLSCLLAGAAASVAFAAPAEAQRVDRIIAFGDSYADDDNAVTLLLASPFVPQATKDQLLQVYSTGRFSGGTNYIDTLAQLLNVPVYNFAVGGALTNDVNTNGPILPGFTTEWNAFLNGGGGVFPTDAGTFDENDLVTVSIGGNDARFYEQTGGTQAGATAAAAISVADASLGLDALVAAGAPTISFLAGNTAILPEIANDPAAQAIRNTYSTAFNQGIQTTLAGYAADGVMVHYLDLTLVGERIADNLEAYGLSNAGACSPSTQCVTDFAYANSFLFYVDNLHLTSAGFAIVGRYVATQLQAPLTLQGTSDLGLDTARQFGRTLTGRVDISAPRDGGLAEGTNLFLVADTFSRDVEMDSATDAFDTDGVGVTAGASFGFGNGLVGIAGNYSKPKARFAGDTASTRSKSWQVGAFAGYAIAGAFAQGYVGYGKDDHKISREGVIDAMTASPDGSHWLAGAKAGYLLPVGIMRAGPVIGLDYAKAKVDGYTESGDEALTLSVSSLSAKALTGSLGLELRGDFDNAGIQLRPFAAAVLEKDLSGDGRTVRFAQTSAPGIVNSWDFEDRSKKAYGRISGGASAAIFSAVTLDATASTTVGMDQGDEVSAHIGLRLGF